MSQHIAQRSEPAIDSVAVLASWCDSATHLAAPPVTQYLAEPTHRQLCTVVAKHLQSTRYNAPADSFLSSEGSSSAAGDSPRRTEDTEEPPPERRLSPAELSQYSVDLLLREYYMMVKDARKKPKDFTAGSSNPLDKLVLLLCVPPPKWLQVRTIFKAIVALICLLSAVLMWCIAVVLPALLWLIRYYWRAGHVRHAALLTVGGSLVLWAAHTVYTAVLRQQREERRGIVTPRTLPPGLAAPLPAVPAASPAVAPHFSNALPNSRFELQAPNQQSAATAAPAADTPSRPPAALVRKLVQLHTTLLGADASVKSAHWTQATMAAEIERLCSTTGYKFRPSLVRSYAAMEHTVDQLNRNFGFQG